MFSMFLMSFLGGDGSKVSGLGLRSKAEGGGEVEWGGEAGGEEGGLDLGVKDLKADGLSLGECMEEEMEVLREDEGKEGDWRE